MDSRRFRDPLAGVKLGIWMLLGAILSIAVTAPFEIEIVSGALFILAMLFLWASGLAFVFRRFLRRG